MLRAKILVVEDEKIIGWDLQLRLQLLGYMVPTIADSGEEALRLVEMIRPDLVLMDIHLRGQRDGLEVGRIIRAQYGIPVIFLTAHTDPETLRQVQLAGASGYLAKPFEEDALAKLIETTLSQSLETPIAMACAM